MADKKQENLIYLKAKDNISLDGVFIKAGKRVGLKKDQVDKILKARNLKNLVTLEK